MSESDPTVQQFNIQAPRYVVNALKRLARIEGIPVSDFARRELICSARSQAQAIGREVLVAEVQAEFDADVAAIDGLFAEELDQQG